MSASSVTTRLKDAGPSSWDGLASALAAWSGTATTGLAFWLFVAGRFLPTAGALPLPALARRWSEWALLSRGRWLRTARRGGWQLRGSAQPIPYVLWVHDQHWTAQGRWGRLEDLLADCLATDPFLALEATSPRLAPTLDTLRRIAPTPLPVLLLGETGSGKEGLARALHGASRRPGPLVAENCAALPESLLEAEMFGVAKGAFTGAESARRGRVLEAHRGTLFLDEIGELSLPLQVKLLRMLQEREIRPLGGMPIRVDVRVVTATHRDLPLLAESDQFRSDLFFRLAGSVIRVPTLRERLADLPYLVAALLDRAEQEGIGPGRHLAPRALARLARGSYRGNVRELDNWLRQAAALARSARIMPHDLPEVGVTSSFDAVNLEARTLSEALLLAGGKKSDAARRLGWTRQKLYRRMTALGLR